MQLVPAPIADGLQALLDRVTETLTVVSPWVKQAGVDAIAPVLERAGVHCQVLMRGDLADFVSGSSDLAAVRRLLAAGAEVGLVRELHAKVYLADRSCALVTSANLTDPGLRTNVEVGLLVEDVGVVEQLHGLAQFWFSRAVPVTDAWVAEMGKAASDCADERASMVRAQRRVDRRGRGLAGARIPIPAPAAPPQSGSSVTAASGPWADELAAWLERRRVPELIPDAVRFFSLALASLPEEAHEWAYWGVYSNRASVIVGNVWTAALHIDGRGRRALLLVPSGTSIAGCGAKPARSTLRHDPLVWLEAPDWHWLPTINGRAELWTLHRDACRRLLAAPMSHTVIAKNNARKTPVADLLRAAPVARGPASEPSHPASELPLAPEGPWTQQLAAWLEQRKAAEFIPDAVRFFDLALTSLPEDAYEWAYWGALKTCVSLTVGGLWVATLATAPKRVDLLVAEDPRLPGWEFEVAPSTVEHDPVAWLFRPGWDSVRDLNERPDLWVSCRDACRRLLASPKSRAVDPRNSARKTPVTELLRRD